MAKTYAKKFYASKAWKACRASFILKQHGICERCGRVGEEVHHIKPITPQNITDPNITLNHDNLMLLCKDCHFQIHEKRKKAGKPVRESELRYVFDENGNIVPKGRVIVVWGSPASGKSTYVAKHMRHMDIRVDLDEIFKCFAGITTRDTDTELTKDYLPFILAAQEAAYKLIEANTGGFATAWIITSQPIKSKREELIKRFNAEEVHIQTTVDEALKRMEADSKRENKEQQRKVIMRYFERLEV